MAFKLSITAGHYKHTPGKRCLKSLDPAETREWVLNSRIAEKIETLLKAYDGIEILRTDDRTGEKDNGLQARTDMANSFGADFYLSIHHNAGINGGKGGGIVAYVYTNVNNETLAWQKDLYNALIAKTGLKGNRATPLAKQNLHECRETKMPSVLLELGFMDSATDVPIILTEDYANKCAEAIVSVVVNRAKLTKKATEEGTSTLYCVQVGAFKEKPNAEEMLTKLKSAGFDGFITTCETTAKEPEVSKEPESEPEVTFKVGDKVKMSTDATVYGKTYKFASWVYNTTLYIKQINGDRVVIDDKKTGSDVLGAVDKKYLLKA